MPSSFSFLSRVGFILIAFAAYGGGNFYVAQRLYQWLTLRYTVSLPLFAAIFTSLALSLFLRFAPVPLAISRMLQPIAYFWLIAFFYTFTLLLLRDLVLLLGSRFQAFTLELLPRISWYSGGLVLLLTVSLISLGALGANSIAYTHYQVSLPCLAPESLTIVLISDTHLGGYGNFESRLPGVVRSINAMNPDLVCIVGDIFNDNFSYVRQPQAVAALFREIQATYGVFASLGNHDGGSSLPQMLEFLAASNIQVLKDEYQIIAERIALVGRLDARPIGGALGLERGDMSQAITTLSAAYTVLVLEHNPRHLGEYGSEVALLLSGHTHGGQIFPINLVTRAMYQVAYGHWQPPAGAPQVIVTSGASTWGPPLRLGSRSEIVRIEVNTVP